MGLFKRFDKDVLKANLKLAVTRMNLLKNKIGMGVKLQKKQVAELLKSQKDESARIKVESIIRDDFKLEAFDILTMFCELLANRIPMIVQSKTCPIDLREAVYSILYAATHTEVEEFQEVAKQFQLKYGKEFIIGAAENKDLSVNQGILFRLNVKVPDPSLCVQYLKQIAKEFGIEWDDTALSNELVTLGANSAMNLNPFSVGPSNNLPTYTSGDPYTPFVSPPQTTSLAPQMTYPQLGTTEAYPTFAQNTNIGMIDNTATTTQQSMYPMYSGMAPIHPGYPAEGFNPQSFDSKQFGALPDNTSLHSANKPTTSGIVEPEYGFDELQRRFDELKRR